MIAWFVIISAFVLCEIAMVVLWLQFLVPLAGAIIGLFNMLLLISFCLFKAVWLWGDFTDLLIPYTGFSLLVCLAILSHFTYTVFNVQSEG